MALKEYEIAAKPEDFTEFVGAGEDKYIGGTAQKLGYKYDINMKHRAYEIYGDYVKNEIFIYEGVKDVLNTLKERGLKITVCSSADMVKVKHNLNAMNINTDFFDFLVSGNDVVNKKPFPDLFLAAAKYLNILECECVVVEDAINGIQAAKAAGMNNVAVTTSFSRNELKDKINPDFIIDDIRELIDIVH
jgi:HAD superfamily hydrolase (TIGR01509 family)